MPHWFSCFVFSNPNTTPIHQQPSAKIYKLENKKRTLCWWKHTQYQTQMKKLCKMTNQTEHVSWICQDILRWDKARKYKTVLPLLKTINVAKGWCGCQHQSILFRGPRLEGWLRTQLMHSMFWEWIVVLMANNIWEPHKARKLKSKAMQGKYVWFCESRSQGKRIFIYEFVWWWCLKWGTLIWRRKHRLRWILRP